MRTQLLPHNQVAYKKVMDAFENSDRTCVCHPTGTGKSYLIAAVSEGMKRVLILAPNIFVLNQVKNVTEWHKGVDYMTYQLLNSRGLRHHYDMIVLDEFHRVGAEEWGASVNEALQQNGGKVFGTTATPIRYLDGERNMAEEIFHGNIASQISIAEAWSKNILPIPTYVTGLYDFSETAKETAQYIRLSKVLAKEDKKERLSRLNNIEMDWQQSGGMPVILKKHISKDTKRIIVFCGSIEIMRNMKGTISKWFQDAELPVANIYSVSSNLTSRCNRNAMKRFEQDTDRGIKIMLSVNMLNEGVHIPRVDAVIMLRTTASRIVYMQQLGRCLTAANTAHPVVLDMVDNITGVNVIHDIRDEYEKLQEHSGKSADEIELRKFNIIDYLESIHDVIAKLKSLHTSIEVKLDEVEKFCDANHRVPSKADGKVFKLWRILLVNASDNPRVNAIREKYGNKQPSKIVYGLNYEQRMQMVKDFCAQNERLPRKKDGDIYIISTSLRTRKDGRQFMNSLREQYKKTVEKKNIVRESTDTMLSSLIEFCEKNGRLPRKGEGEIYLYRSRLMNRNRTTPIPKFIEVYEKYKHRYIDPSQAFETIKDFVESNKRLPCQKDGEIYDLWSSLIGAKYKDPRLKVLMDKYPRCRSKNDIIADWIKFCKTHHRLPGSGGIEGEKSLCNYALRHRDVFLSRPDTKEMFLKYYKMKDRL